MRKTLPASQASFVAVYEHREGRKPRTWDCPLAVFISLLFPSQFYMLLPPLEILNRILLREEYGADYDFGPEHPIGSGLDWKPFALSKDAYKEAIRALGHYELSEPPAMINTPTEWERWQRSV